MMPAPCGWNDEKQPGANPHTLFGALVGGPDKSGAYADKRSDYVKNEVACDYNAAFQGAVAGACPHSSSAFKGRWLSKWFTRLLPKPRAGFRV